MISHNIIKHNIIKTPNKFPSHTFLLFPPVPKTVTASFPLDSEAGTHACDPCSHSPQSPPASFPAPSAAKGQLYYLGETPSHALHVPALRLWHYLYILSPLDTHRKKNPPSADRSPV